jgi:hypothetical protein
MWLSYSAVRCSSGAVQADKMCVWWQAMRLACDYYADRTVTVTCMNAHCGT